MLTDDCPKVKAFLAAWLENEYKCGISSALARDMGWGPMRFEADNPKIAIQKRKWIYLNSDVGVGHFMVDRETEEVYSILSYGQANMKKPRGTIEFLTEFIKNETVHGRGYMMKYWYELHPTG